MSDWKDNDEYEGVTIDQLRKQIRLVVKALGRKRDTPPPNAEWNPTIPDDVVGGACEFGFRSPDVMGGGLMLVWNGTPHSISRDYGVTWIRLTRKPGTNHYAEPTDSIAKLKNAAKKNDGI